MTDITSLQAALVASIQAVNDARATLDGQSSVIDQQISAMQNNLRSGLQTLQAQLAQSVIIGNTTLTVGANQQYASLQAAWDYLVAKQLAGFVTIKILDGVYQTTGYNLINQPASSYVNILGNAANPDNCVIQLINDPTGHSQGISIRNASGLTINGLRIDCSDRANNVRGLIVSANSHVYTPNNGLRVNNCNIGINVSDLSQLQSGLMSITNCLTGILTENNAVVDARGATIAGPGKTTPNIGPAICAMNGGSVYAWSANVSNHSSGYYASGGGRVYANAQSQASLCSYGYLADWRGHINANSPDTGANANRAIALNCDHGFRAYTGGTIDATNARADGCPIGFEANQGGFVGAYGSRAVNCATWGYYAEFGGLMDANATSANLSNTPNGYNLAASIIGNDGALIRRS